MARGFALGLAVNFFPTFGFGMILSGIVAKAFNANIAAGVVGGTILTFLWPVLFYVNVRVGRFFGNPPEIIESLAEVTNTTVEALVWGHTFMVGAMVNAFFFGGVCYLILRILHWRIRPKALAYFRRHSKDHQKRFRLPRPRR